MVGKTRSFKFSNLFLYTLQIIKTFDPFIWISVLSLSTIGVLFIYSSSINVNGAAHLESFPLFAKQIIWIALGIVFSLLVRLIKWQDLTIYAIYCLPLFFLFMIIALFLPSHQNSHSWIRLGPLSFQPAEPLKILFILAYSYFCTRFKEKLKTFYWLLLFLFCGSIFLLITVAQNDLGTASVFIPLMFVLLYKAGAKKSVLTSFLLVFAFVYFFTLFCGLAKLTSSANLISILFASNLSKILIPAVLILISILTFVGFFLYKNVIYYYFCYFSTIIAIAFCLAIFIVPTQNSFGLLGKYQIERIVYPLDNSLKLSTSYNIEQARTAIGSGGFLGKGFLNGDLSHRRFVPEQPTDFIFSIVAEEWGWCGSLLILFLYGMLLFRILYMIFKTSDMLANLIQWGIFALFFYHMIINIGMNIGVIPVIGIPLMFVSYGGTAIFSSFIAIGVLEVIWSNFKNQNFYSHG